MPVVESIPGKRSGAGIFEGTRTPVSTVFENLQDITVDELAEEFGVNLIDHHTVAEARARGWKKWTTARS